MKKTTIIFILFALFASSCHSRKDDFVIIPLQMGENEPVRFRTLEVSQIDLRHDTVPRERFALDAKLRIANTDRTQYFAFRYYLEKVFVRQGWNTSSSGVFENYIFGWKINENDIYLVIESLDFGKWFYIGRNPVVVGNLSISMIYEGHEHTVPRPPPPPLPGEVANDFFEVIDSCGTIGWWRMVLSEGRRRKEFNFSVCGCRPIGYVEWRNYRIDVSPDFQFKVTRR